MMTRRFTKAALLAGSVMAGAVFASPAYAQSDNEVQENAAGTDIDAEAGEGSETILVTGSRIQRRDLTSTSPLAVVQDEEFRLSGAVNVEQVINTLPQVVPGATAFSNNPGGGVATLDLRGIGSARTLVLVNGRRWVSFDTTQVVDLNTIPQFLLDSVDVVTGGASAVYGSDALAGVVNFRLRQDLNGAEVGGQYSLTDEGDGARYQAYVALGATTEDGRGNVTAFAEYFNRKPIFQGARDFSRFALGDDGDTLSPGGSATTPQGRVAVAGRQTVSSICNGSTVLFLGFGGDTNCNGVNPTDAAGNVTDAADRAGLVRGVSTFGSAFGANFGRPGVSDTFDFPGDLYNYAPDNYLQVPQERYLIGGYGSYEVSPALTAFAEVTFVNNRVANELAPTPVTGTFNVNLASIQPFVSAADFANLQAIDANETAILAQQNARCAAAAAAGVLPTGAGAQGETRAPGCAITGTGAAARYSGLATAAPFGPQGPGGTGLDARLPGIVQLGINRRVTETGSRNQLDERNAFRVLAGVKGPVFNDWTYEAYYSYARTRNAQIQTGNVSASAYRRLVESGGINVFGAGTLDADDVDAFSILAQNGEISTLQVANASVAGGLGNLGLGGDDIGVALGVEYRKVSAEFIPDTALSSGDVVGFNAGRPTEGSYNVKEVFGEVRVPIVEDAPFFDRLEINGAGRYSDYSLEAVGGVWSYAGGIEWAPVPDLTFRGQFQRAVRAPNVGELFLGQAVNFPTATDPCSSRQPVTGQTAAVRDLCIATGVPAGLVFSPGIQANTQIQSLIGGNPDLEEETSDTYTIGAVFRPSFIPRLNISVDYYNITVDNYISTLGGGLQGTLNLCYNVIQDINSIYCQAIANGGRNPSTGEIGTATFQPLIGNANVAKIETSGIDLQVDYSLPVQFGLFGEESSLNFFFLGTYTDEFKFFAVQERDDFVQCAGRFGALTCGNPRPEFKWSSRLSFIDGPLTTSIRWRHLGEVQDDDDGTDYVVEQVDDINYFDLTFGLDITEEVSMAFGVNNIFNEKPQVIGDNQEQANTYPAVYDVLGRDYFISAAFKF